MKNENRNEINLDKVHLAMRSLYRLAELQNMLSPDVLINNEKSLLSRYLLALNGAEILYLTRTFTSYYEEQRTKNALEDERLVLSIDQYLTRLN